jgi:hypothetical protein
MRGKALIHLAKARRVNNKFNDTTFTNDHMQAIRGIRNILINAKNFLL